MLSLNSFPVATWSTGGHWVCEFVRAVIIAVFDPSAFVSHVSNLLKPDGSLTMSVRSCPHSSQMAMMAETQK